jgi:hypothetical protein
VPYYVELVYTEGMKSPPTIDWSGLQLGDLVCLMALPRTKSMPNHATACLFLVLAEFGWDGGVHIVKASRHVDGAPTIGQYDCPFLQWKSQTANALGETVEEFFDGRWKQAGIIIPRKEKQSSYSQAESEHYEYLTFLYNSPDNQDLVAQMRGRLEQLAMEQNTAPAREVRSFMRM